MSYSIKIIDNDTGRVVTDCDNAKAIVGSITDGGQSAGVYHTAGTSIDCAMAIYTAQAICDVALKKNPTIRMMLAAVKAHEEELKTVTMDLSELKKNGN